MPSISDALHWADTLLKESQTEHALRDARLLLAGVLGVELGWVLAHPESDLAGTEWGVYAECVRQRAAGKPVAYLVGYREFYAREFRVSPAVLIPRPETELLIEQGLKVLGWEPGAGSEPSETGGQGSGVRRRGLDAVGQWPVISGQPRRDGTLSPRGSIEWPRLLLADIGTGSGCIAVTLAAEIPHALVVATDISEAALQVARENAERHGVISRIDFKRADLLPPEGSERYDAIFSNPPYVATREPRLSDEVRRNEPQVALFAGEGGMEMYRRIVPLAAQRLKNGGWLLLELGYQAEERVRALFVGALWQSIQVFADLQGIARCLVAQRRDSR